MTSPRQEEELHSTPLDRANEHVGSQQIGRRGERRHASNTRQSRGRLPGSRFDSYPSTHNWSHIRMSINPAQEVTDILQSPAASSPPMSSSESSSTASEASMEQENDGIQGALVVSTSQKMDKILPEDDGMHSLRVQLHQIRTLAISTEEKARRMHALMTEDYLAHRTGIPSPMSFNDGDSKSLSDEPPPLDVGVTAMPIDPTNPYNIRYGDLEPSFSPLAVTQGQDQDLGESMEAEYQLALGCRHYLRNVKIQCFDCHRWFPCRYCHDQSDDLPFPHTLRRKMITNMMCMLCQTPQPAAEACFNCQEWAAHYYCSKCKLWDNDINKSIYHCDDCGICRLGEGLGKDFVHCKKCNVCISISTSAAHPCIEGATEGDCPLCLEGMFASRAKVVSLPCGHYMHALCYKDLMAVTYKCPVCSKSAVNMELQWRKLDDEIRFQPMPEDEEELDEILPQIETHIDENHINEFSERARSVQRRPKIVWIGCNDCGGRCWTDFHWLGLKCRVCDSYNTTQMAPSAGYETETERFIRQQQVHRHHDFTGDAVLRDAGIGVEDTLRIDSPLRSPFSASQLAVPVTPGSPLSTPSSPGRYFVRPEEPRRPSFTVPRFSTPTLPTLANLPEMPRLPRMPNIPQLPNMPAIPNLPNMPNLPHMPNLPNMPHLPHMPEFGLPRLSPYDMFDSISRSLSPMRYYLQGHDIQDEQLRRVANRSPTSVHSDPTANASSSRRRRSTRLSEGYEIDGWASDDPSVSEGGGSDEGFVLADGADEDDDDSDTDSDELSDTEMAGQHDLDFELPGHR